MDLTETVHWIQNLPEKKKQLLTGAASVLAGAALLIAYFQSGPDALSYASAEAAFVEWSASPEDEKLYQSMQEMIRAAPTLQNKYEATIAQTLLSTDKIEEALALAHRSLNRVKGEVPFHATYAETTLLIEQKDFQQALQNAVALKEQMGPSFLKEWRGGSLLYLHNLLRIACLQQELKNRPGEKAAWEELESALESQGEFARVLVESFSEKEMDLWQYIKERKRLL